MTIIPGALAAVLGVTLLSSPVPTASEPTDTRDPLAVAQSLADGQARTARRGAADTIAGTLTTFDGDVAVATVCAFDPSGGFSDDWCADTDDDGRYALTVPTGTYRVGFFPENMAYAYEFYADAPTLAEGQLVTSGRSDVDALLDENAWVSGAAVTSDGQAVCAFDDSSVYCTAVSDSRYGLYLDPGTYAVALFEGNEVVEWFDDSDDPQFSVHMEYRTDLGNIDLDPRTQVVGQVVNGTHFTTVTAFQRVGGSWVARGKTTLLGTDTRFRLPLPAGTYRLEFRMASPTALPRYSGGAWSLDTASDVVARAHRTTLSNGVQGGGEVWPEVRAGDKSVQWGRTRVLDASGKELGAGENVYHLPPGVYTVEASPSSTTPALQKHVYGTGSTTFTHSGDKAVPTVELPVIGHTKPAAPKPTARFDSGQMMIRWQASPKIADRSHVSIDGRTFTSEGEQVLVPGLRAGKRYTAKVRVVNGDEVSTGSVTFTAPKVTSKVRVWGTPQIKPKAVDGRFHFRKAQGRKVLVQQRVAGGKWHTVQRLTARDDIITSIRMPRLHTTASYRLVLPKGSLFDRQVSRTITAPAR